MASALADDIVITGHETWRSTIAGKISLKRLDHRGEMTKTELVEGGKSFNITPQERKLNQRAVNAPGGDVFTNGFLVPVHLVDGESDNDALLSNPNMLSEDDMRQVVVSARKLADRLPTVTNERSLRRLLEVAYECDVKLSHAHAIQTRIDEVVASNVKEPPAATDARPNRRDRPRAFDPDAQRAGTRL